MESDLKSRLSRHTKVKSHHEVIQRRNNCHEYKRSYKSTIQQNLHYFFDVLALHSKEMCPFLASNANIFQTLQNGTMYAHLQKTTVYRFWFYHKTIRIALTRVRDCIGILKSSL